VISEHGLIGASCQRTGFGVKGIDGQSRSKQVNKVEKGEFDKTNNKEVDGSPVGSSD
jgi:hypothetical protein